MRRATAYLDNKTTQHAISIHALLAESDNAVDQILPGHEYISIHALLAESDDVNNPIFAVTSISIHALLAESDQTAYFFLSGGIISIHALLAESDHPKFFGTAPHTYFYPRSPCGERRGNQSGEDANDSNFYPRSPCGERRREASESIGTLHFYPRSPCGERRRRGVTCYLDNIISIHALLAESDCCYYSCTAHNRRFLSTLSLRRATYDGLIASANFCKFLSTLSLRRATASNQTAQQAQHISIHALLAESDHKPNKHQNLPRRFLSTLSLRRATTWQRGSRVTYVEFLSTLSLRRATEKAPYKVWETQISIHALLAESDNADIKTPHFH